MTTGHRQEISHTPLSEQVRIILTTEPELELPLHLEEEIETIWQREKAKRNLYNSQLFSLSAYDENRLIGRFVEYRHFIASRQKCEIQDQLQIYPLGVSGLCLCRNNVLIGTRDLKLASFGGYLECVPSGGIEARAYMHGEVDFLAQTMWELQEEACISEKNVKEVHTLGLFYSPHEGVYDIGTLLRVDLLEQEMDSAGSQEYPLLNWYTFEEWEEKLENPDSKIVPLSSALWQTYCKYFPS